MTEPCRPTCTPRGTSAEQQCIDAQLLARAADINESVAEEFSNRALPPLENPLLERMARLGIETEAAVRFALQRAYRISFHMRRERAPRDSEELDTEARRLSAEERAHVAALAVAWWDGALTALRASELDTREDAP